MTASAPGRTGLTVDDWLAAEVGTWEWPEVQDGELVARPVGGNPHHVIARHLAYEAERQWPGSVATAPGNWVVEARGDGTLQTARIPDLLVGDPSLLMDSTFDGVPDLVAEVWSPGNRLAEMNRKRREYLAAGLPAFLEALLAEDGDVHLEWLIPSRGRWVTEAMAVGDLPLEVNQPRPFRVVPSALLALPADSKIGTQQRG